MKKQKTSYILVKYKNCSPQPFRAKKEIPYEIKLAARLFLDESMFNWQKARLERQINSAIDLGDRNQFEELSIKYQPYIKE
ncbi:IDEAL domain-containing protein [Salinibacillus xinjiangensis]|uniref:IDEAL domain-containing protein n=1 Tax=Salinibacillus xinjiangensis TaxID=1229268 RepID=A0A6G1X7H6_9BACI|nr:IDEAL domain-containing protein [Salinibacillus xinjiangensis]MRG86897.1 IDEAL domain-containing protein [Salinibacillus xinjiangensis]